MKLSVVLPAHNEAAALPDTLRALYDRLSAEKIDHELLVVDDNSTDATQAVLATLAGELPTLRVLRNPHATGYGLAVRCGLEAFTGDAVAVYMADASDSPHDLVRFWRTMELQGVDCVFGSRFMKGGRLIDYPQPKLFFNRAANLLMRLLFGVPYNDVTNAFKLYKRQAIDGVKPILSHHYNLTVELPLKAIIRGYSYAVVPNSWVNRKTGISKLQLKEMGSRYIFIIIYCFIEKWLAQGDYVRHKSPS